MEMTEIALLITFVFVIPVAGIIIKNINGKTRKQIAEGIKIGRKGSVNEPPHPYRIHTDEILNDENI